MSTAITTVPVAEKPESYFTSHIRPMLRQWPVRLILIQLAAELFLPIIVFMTPVPAAAENLLEVIAASIMLLTVLFMLSRDRIPSAVLVIFAITLVWSIVALFEGQSVAATAWGWWKFFMYPIIGLFAYLTVRWPRGFADWWLKFLIGLMAFQLVVQVFQELLGIGGIDDRAGTFAQNGVGPQNMFNWFVICFALGTWIATRRWKPLVIVLIIGLLATIINGTKFFLPSLAILGLATVGLQLISGGRLRQLFIFTFVVGVAAAVFLPIFNRYIVDVRGGNPLQSYFEPTQLERYLFNDGQGDRDGKYNLGRMLSVTYGYQLISRDPTTQLFGMGLGARSFSSGLGISGAGLENDLYGRAQGTGLLTRIQEQGIMGLAVMWLFFLWLMWRLYRDTKTHSDQSVRSLEFGLIIFTFLWPLWLWYTNPWAHGVMMVLYWTAVGYVFSDIHRRERRKQWRDNRDRLAAAAPRPPRPPRAVQSTVDVDPRANGSGRSYPL
jgi:hypothetical protein